MSRLYTPRRQSKRWLDGDCPRGVLAIYDSKGGGERYTVFYAETHVCGGKTYIFGRGMSADPFHPQGVGISIEMEWWQVAQYRYRVRHQAAKWSGLPDDVKRCVIRDLTEDAADAA